MSGGHFDYEQYRVGYLAERLKRIIENNGIPSEYGTVRNYSAETLKEFKICADQLSEAVCRLQCIDWLLCGDVCEEKFHTDLKKDLQENSKID